MLKALLPAAAGDAVESGERRGEEIRERRGEERRKSSRGAGEQANAGLLM